MEFRRLISFGKSSYVVSLPKLWITKNGLKKGDLISLEENGPNLLVSKKENTDQKIEKEKTIYIDGKDESSINREVCSAYIQNYRKITLKGKEIKNNVKVLQRVVQSLIALEIMEQTSDSIVAKDFLNMDTVSTDELIRKMDIVTRTMMKEACKIFSEDTYESLNERDQDVNRLYFLLYRAVLYSLENPIKTLRNFNHSGIDLLKIKHLGFYIEAIADEARRFARHARTLDIPAEKQKWIENEVVKMYDLYVNTMKATYNKDIELALKLSDVKKELDKDIELLEKEVQKIPNLNRVITRLQRLASLIHNLGRVVYTMTYAEEP
ncbi:MAG: phosphate uptake regulator PhoU [Nanoarchaeota archaeon]|nr:phosphate uptake regulator PhoU [Nanoarchaeota archaeon]MBU1643561.1 phosphate uptake regulator PhoU [Nanoarchaeota archaeon]MBU1976785.1 phosphate uptake regulator PhoU [Nanoarchaeota archaeon]